MNPAQPTKKTRADSRLGNLPQERQDQIAGYARTHTIEQTVEWLGENGTPTSTGAVSTWLSAWRLSRQLAANASTVDLLLSKYRENNPNATAEEIRVIGQSFFSALALQQQDPKVWAMTQSLDLKREHLTLQREHLTLDREKFEELKRKADQADAARSTTESALTPEQKEARMREIFGLA